MDDASKRKELERSIAERRKLLGDWAPQDSSVRELAQSGSRHLLPPRAPAKSSAISVVLLATLGALALIGCTAAAAAVAIGGSWLQGSLSDPTTTVQSFYGALEQRDYQGAYQYFSSDARTHMSESQFADQFGDYDTIDGVVASYSLSTPKLSANGSAADISVVVSRRGNTNAQQLHALTLIKENGSWRINSIGIRSYAVPSTPGQHG